MAGVIDATGERGRDAVAEAAGGVLFVYAHPDDEVFGAAGTMAALRERGVPVALVCATRGDVGQIVDPSLATPETLPAVREAELRAAAAELGVADVRVLGYRDSGMEGTPDNDDPRALVQQPEEVVAARIAAIVREVRPRTVVTFGPDGIYGHPDHLYVHRVTVRAVHVAAGMNEGLRTEDSGLSDGAPTPGPTQDSGLSTQPSSQSSVLSPRSSRAWRVEALYFSTTPRERIQERAARRQGPFKEMTAERLALIGTPRAEITTALDVAAYRERKRAALRAHRTQIGPDGPMAELPREEVERVLSREHFVRVGLPWSRADDVEADPLVALAADVGTDPL